jgi:hypothetical protein
MRTLFGLILGLLREIGDENAYERHLLAHGMQNSPDEYRRFIDARFRGKYARAKCC